MDGITIEEEYIIFRYKGKEYTLCRENEKKEDGSQYFTHEEAVQHCYGKLDRHLPSIKEREELLRDWCNWRGYVMYDEDCVYSGDNNQIEVGRRFAEDFNLPFAGVQARSPDGADVYNLGKTGYYWSNTLCISDNDIREEAYYLSLRGYSVCTNYDTRNLEEPVRCFYDGRALLEPYLFVD